MARKQGCSTGMLIIPHLILIGILGLSWNVFEIYINIFTTLVSGTEVLTLPTDEFTYRMNSQVKHNNVQVVLVGYF